MSRITHFEIPVSDTEKSMSFYKNVFGWKFQQWGNEEYFIAITGDENEKGINGAIMKKRDPAQPVVNSLEVKNLDAVIKDIEANGGKIVVQKMAIPSIGWLAYFKDPDENIHGIMQPDANAK